MLFCLFGIVEGKTLTKKVPCKADIPVDNTKHSDELIGNFILVQIEVCPRAMALWPCIEI